MTDDKQLADRVVALGVGASMEFEGGDWFSAADSEYCLLEDDFVRDWRVAGALMEKCHNKGIHIIIERAGIIVPLGMTENGECISTGAVIDESLPRAIIEACCEALEITMHKNRERRHPEEIDDTYNL